MSEEVKSACVPCVLPRALVVANPNIAQISELELGDKVLDAQGNYSEIVKIWERDYDGQLIDITIPYQQEKLTLTPEHPVLSVSCHECHRCKILTCYPKNNPECSSCEFRPKYDAQFVPAERLTNQFLLMPRLKGVRDVERLFVSDIIENGYEKIGNKIKPMKINAHNRGRSALAINNEIKINDDFMALVGFYLAEGCCVFGTRGAQTRFDFNITEKDYAQEVKQLLFSVFGVTAYIYKENNTARVCISSVLIARLFNKLFGKGATEKHIPTWFHLLPLSKQAILLEKYWRGDGHQWINENETETQFSATTVSEKLACSIRLILHRLGIIHSFGKYFNKTSKIDGRRIKGGNFYQIAIHPPSAITFAKLINYPVPKNWVFTKSHRAGIDKNWIYLPILNIERRQYAGKVMNLTTSPDNTFTVAGIAVHNCAIGHFSTSAKLLSEAVRFKKDGLKSPQVLDDIAASIGEQNALERIDLTPAKIRKLPPWEKPIAQEALDKSRELRHKLESVKNMDELTNIAADIEEFYKYLNREWQSKRIDECPECDDISKRLAEELPGGSPSPTTHAEGVVKKAREVGESIAEKRRKFIESIRAEIKH